MNHQDYKKAQALSKQLSSLVSKVEKKRVKTAPSVRTFKYKALGNKPAPWEKAVVSPYSKTLSQRIKNLGAPRTEKVIEKPVYYGKPGDRGPKGDKGDSGRNGEDGATPVKGIHYFTEQEINAIKLEVTEDVKKHIPASVEPLRVDMELAKQIVQLMHLLPEQDKLEVSKGIRNAQSFIFGKNKYQISELMHGGGSSSSGSSGYQVPTSGLVNGTNTVFTWATAPNVIVLDNGNAMNKVSADGTVNWTGTTTTTLNQAPNTNIYATA